jgi:phosphoglycerol transferase MdoB-like AlkP superfamily enzyme
MIPVIPSSVGTIARILGLTFAILGAARLGMLVLVWEDARALPARDLFHALYIGAKFDLRIALFACLPVILLPGLPWLEKRPGLRPWAAAWYALAMTAICIAYAVDFGFFFYLRHRVDVTLFELLPDVFISASMVWQTYPVLRIALALALVALMFRRIMLRLLRRHVPSGMLGARRRAAWTLGLVAALFLTGYGQISASLFPLRWSNAYFSPNATLVILALNPVQNIYDAWVSLQTIPPDIQAAREAYPRIASWLGVQNPDAARLDYWRFAPGPRPSPKRNVVILLMESLGTPRTSLASGLFEPDYKPHGLPDTGPDDPTPNLRRLVEQSIYFPWFFAPTRTTARAIFTTLTGIPDVNRSGGTSSRNPAMVDQFSIISEFSGYDLSYMIGGSASWANIRGLLTHNIPGLNLREEDAWKAPNVDVWGISDLALLLESIDYYDTRETPFFSIIQTAGFHRPWTIPEDNAGFAPRRVDDAVLRYYGYENVDEYNSMRFADHALGEFFRAAAARPWFRDTVFLVMGDHGLNMASDNVPPGYLACLLQSNHVPMLIHAPGLLAPAVLGLPCGQTDVLPTLAALAGIRFRNHGLGRDLLDPARLEAADQGREFLFLGGDTEKTLRLVMDGYGYFANESGESLFRLRGGSDNLAQTEAGRAQSMGRIARDVFHTAKYMLFNNKKADAPAWPAR